jgi:hypothetical protein
MCLALSIMCISIACRILRFNPDRRTIDSILKSTSDADVQMKRTCLLEQGYAILIERTIVNKNTLDLRISDMHKILTVEYDKSDGERRECLGRGLHHQKQVLCSIHSANKDNTTDAHLIRKASSLQKFEMAENFCSDPLWEHGEVLYPDILVFHHHFCHTQLSVFCAYLISSNPTYSY